MTFCRSYFGNINFFGGFGNQCAKSSTKLKQIEQENQDAMFVFLSHTNYGFHELFFNSNMTSFRFDNKRASYPFGIISLAHAPVNVTDFSIGSVNCVRHFPQT
jgi:hypothetical protein